MLRRILDAVRSAARHAAGRFRIWPVSYKLTMDYSEILENLFVGSYPSTRDDFRELKRDAGITAVLNLQTDDDFDDLDIEEDELCAHAQAASIVLERVPVRDFDPEDLCDKLPACVEALSGLLGAGHTVFVHCNLGVGRSPSVVIAYLYRCQNLDLAAAERHVQLCRPCSPSMESIRQAAWEEQK